MAKPKRKSVTIWSGLAAAVLSAGAVALGHDVTTDDLDRIAALCASIGSGVAGLVAIWGRIRATQRIGSGSGPLDE